MIGPLLFLLFVYDLPDVLETLTLLFADDVKMVTHRSQSMNLRSSLTFCMGLVEEMGPTDESY